MKRQQLTLYLLIILPLLAAIGFFLFQGKTLQPSTYVAEIKNVHIGAGGITDSFKHPLTILLMQILIVLATSKAVGYLFIRIGQQSVIGEIVAGILLGPSLLGWV